jgi:tetratricopeptide (TPR) repeat protein
MLSRILSTILIFIIISCGSISFKDQYSKKFLKDIKAIKLLYKSGDKGNAFVKLDLIKDEGLTPTELTMKYNMRGFIHFSLKEFKDAIVNFKKAINFSGRDSKLNSQANLNLASSYFKTDNYKSAFIYIRDVDHKYLGERDFKVFTKLYFVLAKQINEPYEIVRSVVLIQQKFKTLEDVRNGQYASVITDKYFQMSKTERMRFLEEFENKQDMTIAYLALQESKKLYYSGDKSTAKDVVDWIKSQYAKFPTIVERASNFMARIENFAKMDLRNVGVILPLTGPKAVFGKKALRGIDVALNKYKNIEVIKENNKEFNIFVKDSKMSSIIATTSVKDLVEKHFVSFIIGGLFPSTAVQEYLEAKKYGVLFISLSPVYLPKEDKNHLLIEVPGSIESQIHTMLTDEFLDGMGKQVAVLYPESDGGQAYVNEFWRKSKEFNVNISTVSSYEKNLTDFRSPVKNLLGLKFKRERQEEFDVWNEIFQLEKRGNIKRRQTLKPIVDFDWVFLPSIPRDTLQIIPSFAYFDAKKIKFVGNPSWRSRKLLKKYKRLGRLFFIGDDNLNQHSEFFSFFTNRFGRKPRLIETMAYEGVTLGFNFISSEFSSREQFEKSILTSTTAKADFGEWNLTDGVWIKKMQALTFYKNKIVRAQLNQMAMRRKDKLIQQNSKDLDTNK